MGQYYHPIILGERGGIKGYWYSHKILEGLKLMEHSYINNNLCNCVENYLIKSGGARVVWAGDYADPEKIKYTKEEAQEIWKALVNAGKVVCSFKAFWKSNVPELFKPETNEDENLYSLCNEKMEQLPNGKEKLIRKAKPELEYDIKNHEHRYLVNDTLKEYVDTWTVPYVGGMRVNPLPLLTCEGNGRGGGDYSGLNEDMVGRWARHFIRLVPFNWNLLDELKREGYKEIKPDFCEGYEAKQSLVEVANILTRLLADDYYANDENFVAPIRFAIDKLNKALPRKTEKEKKVLLRLTEQEEAKAGATNG